VFKIVGHGLLIPLPRLVQLVVVKHRVQAPRDGIMYGIKILEVLRDEGFPSLVGGALIQTAGCAFQLLDQLVVHGQDQHPLDLEERHSGTAADVQDRVVAEHEHMLKKIVFEKLPGEGVRHAAATGQK
jgi:hypothetical protein